MSASALAALTPVTPIVQSAVKVLSTELVRFEGKVYRRIRLKEPRRDKTGALLFTKAGRVRMHTVTRMEPVNVSASLNPIGLGVFGILGAATAFVLFGRVGGALPLGGEFEIYKGPFADQFDTWQSQQALKKETSQACAELKRQHDAQISIQGRFIIRQAAQEAGCAWAL